MLLKIQNIYKYSFLLDIGRNTFNGMDLLFFHFFSNYPRIRHCYESPNIQKEFNKGSMPLGYINKGIAGTKQ